MYTIDDCYKYGRDRLLASGLNPIDADFLLPIALGVDKSKVRTIHYVTNRQYSKFCRLIRRRCRHVSMDKLIGYTEFLNITIPFSRHTLTPRQETEILADMIINDNKNSRDLEILDLCTGSGCLGIAMANNLNARVTMSDISRKAIRRASRNARLNNAKVEIVRSNLFDNITSTFDIIISNPPYIPTTDVRDLEKEVRKFDPRLALDGGEDGLDFYRIIADKGYQYLRDSGKIYLEIGIDQGDKVKDILSHNFDNINIVQDYSGIDRYIIAQKKRER